MSSGATLGNVFKNVMIQQKLTPALVAANTTAEQTFTVKGLLLNDFVEVNKPSLDAGVSIGNVRVSAADTLAIQYINATALGVTPTAETYLIQVTRAGAGTLAGGIGD